MLAETLLSVVTVLHLAAVGSSDQCGCYVVCCDFALQVEKRCDFALQVEKRGGSDAKNGFVALSLLYD